MIQNKQNTSYTLYNNTHNFTITQIQTPNNPKQTKLKFIFPIFLKHTILYYIFFILLNINIY